MVTVNDRDPKPDNLPFPTTCAKCGRSISDYNINWNAPRDPVCVVCAYPRTPTPPTHPESVQ